MSRTGNCYDNAPMEYFSVKDELEYKDCTSIDELRDRINEYIHFLQYRAISVDIKEDDSNEYRNHLLAA
ncbi:Integrase core domain-containing protein [Paenibacillus sp. cl6col]|nr:Integrase core domain-containing protein [Paenibacillus sp. cl6col]